MVKIFSTSLKNILALLLIFGGINILDLEFHLYLKCKAFVKLERSNHCI